MQYQPGHIFGQQQIAATAQNQARQDGQLGIRGNRCQISDGFDADKGAGMRVDTEGIEFAQRDIVQEGECGLHQRRIIPATGWLNFFR